jgi:hypothetical protein
VGGADRVSIIDRVNARLKAKRRGRPDVLAGVPGGSSRAQGVTVLVRRPGDWPPGGHGVTGAGPGLAPFDDDGGGWRDVVRP